MGYWGLRPLISTLFICVWITSCSLTSYTAPTLLPTQSPPVTLTLRVRDTRSPDPSPASPTVSTPEPETAAASHIYIVRPGDTLLGIALDLEIPVEQLRAANPDVNPLALQVGQSIIVPQPGALAAAVSTPLPLQLAPPVCHYLITGSRLCLGKVTNPLSEPVAHVRLRIRLTAADGEVLAETTTGVEQTIIPPGQSAPYSVVFDASTSGDEQVSVELIAVSPAPGSGLILLDVVDEQAGVTDRGYRVAATVLNTTGVRAHAVRVVLTLLDADGQVAGFRVATLPESLDPGEQRTISIDVLPQAMGENLTHQLHAEARLSGN